MSIRLVRAALQRDRKESNLWNGAAFFAEVQNLGFEKTVSVRVEPDLEIECSFLTSLGEGREIWAGYWSDFGFFPARHPDLRFMLRYRVAGKVFTDPAAAPAAEETHHVLNERRPYAVGEGCLALNELRSRRFADAASYADFAAASGERLEDLPLPQSAVFPAVLAWGWADEKVTGSEELTLEVTADGEPVEGTLIAARLAQGRWFFVHHHPGTATTVELAADCNGPEASARDDNFGRRHLLVVDSAACEQERR